MGNQLPTAPGTHRSHADFSQYLNGPTIDEIDLNDPKQVEAATMTAVVKDELQNARMRILKNAVIMCYRQFGVNHMVKCRPIYLEYLKYLEATGPFRIPVLHEEEDRKKQEQQQQQQQQQTHTEAEAETETETETEESDTED